MRIVCPACAAAYEVPESLLGTGRPVRCARCARQWVPEAAAPATPVAGERRSPGPAAPPPLSVVERSGLEASRLDRSGLETTGLEPARLEPTGAERPGERPILPAPPIAIEPPPLAATPPAEPMAVEPVLAVPDEDIRDPRRERRENTLVRLGWAASVLVIVLLAWAAYGWRADIMHAWPASERLYAALGLIGGR